MPTITTSAPASAPSPSITPSPSSSLSSRSRRKRSSPTASSKDTLQSCSSTSSISYPVPDSIAWLEQLTLKLTVDSHAKADAFYVLTVDHAKSKSVWCHARSFEDYRGFQRRLLKAVRHGHFCHAECPWLYTFIRSYFPKTCLLGHVIARKQVAEQRREILEQCLLTLQSFLAKRGNHCCSVLTSAVADEVLSFINGEEGALLQLRHGAAACASNAVAGHFASHSSDDGGSTTHRGSWGSNHSNSGEESYGEVHEERDESEASRASSHEDENICGLCHSHLSDEAHSPSSVPLTPTALANETLPASPKDSTSTSETASSTASSLPSPLPIRKVSSKPRHHQRTTHFYTTRLACGHQFHDECIVPKLNESMHCPTCGKQETSRS